MESNNADDLKNVLSSVLITLSEKNKSKSILEYGPLEINCFSICFWVDIDGVNGKNSYYIKIPKIIFYDENKQCISDLSQNDIKLAVDEYESLNYLSDHWDSSLGVHFVETLGYIKNYNAIITRRINGEFFFKIYRKYDKYGKPEKYKSDSAQMGMEKFGKSLRLFHSQSFYYAKFNANNTILKFDQYIDILKKYGVNHACLKKLMNLISKYKDFEYKAAVVNNYKGIDIRQIFMDQHNELYIIDPGKIKKGFSEIDIARFIVTCRILYWGTLAIIFRIVPSKSYEEYFLNGYYGLDERPSKMLRLLIVKEMLKHWNMAHISLGKRKWPRYIKYILRKMYIDPFYNDLLLKELYEPK